MSPKMFLMQVTRYSCRSAVMPSKFLHARMTTSRGWFSSHSEISVSVSCTGDRSLGGRGPPRLSKGLRSHSPDPGSGPEQVAIKHRAALVGHSCSGDSRPTCPGSGEKHVRVRVRVHVHVRANAGAGSFRGTATASR